MERTISQSAQGRHGSLSKRQTHGRKSVGGHQKQAHGESVRKQASCGTTVKKVQLLECVGGRGGWGLVSVLVHKEESLQGSCRHLSDVFAMVAELELQLETDPRGIGWRAYGVSRALEKGAKNYQIGEVLEKSEQ